MISPRVLAEALEIRGLADRAAAVTGMTTEEVLAEAAKRVVLWGQSARGAVMDVLGEAVAGEWPPPED